MLFLAAFSWWGALQGFGPAIAVVVVFYREIRDAAIWCLPAAAILALVRWLNRRDAPRTAKNRAASADAESSADAGAVELRTT